MQYRQIDLLHNLAIFRIDFHNEILADDVGPNESINEVKLVDQRLAGAIGFPNCELLELLKGTGVDNSDLVRAIGCVQDIIVFVKGQAPAFPHS